MLVACTFNASCMYVQWARHIFSMASVRTCVLGILEIFMFFGLPIKPPRNLSIQDIEKILNFSNS